MRSNPLTQLDFYKTDHRRQYPDGTTEVYSNFTPRSAKLAKVIAETYDNHVVFFGLQGFIKEYLIEQWTDGFFNQPKFKVVEEYQRRMDTSLGASAIECSHIAALHDLGYLPLRIKALPEGARVPIGVPVFTIVNTHPEFFWLTNYVESVMSCFIWKMIVSATTAFEYKKLLTSYAIKTGTDIGFVNFQAHDFSFRGMSGPEDAARNGCGHLTSFFGTDTVPAIDYAENYYYANTNFELIGCSVPATEHSVACLSSAEYATKSYVTKVEEFFNEETGEWETVRLIFE